ncbi:MAG TPA: hypothetical protein VM901_13070 [Bdellovibrionota bacterium]|jgi:hypothetical protein|nr:hypothetical protein [Bdellovibrionota bacterium]
MRARRIHFSFGLLLTALSCGKADEVVKLPVDIELDPGLSHSQQTTIKEDFEWLIDLEMPAADAPAVPTREQRVLWAERQAHLQKFQNPERDEGKMEMELLNTFEQTPAVSRWFEEIFGGSESSDVVNFVDDRINYLEAPNRNPNERLYLATAKMNTYTPAFNRGTELFFTALGAGESLRYSFAGRFLPLDDSRVGLVSLGKSFFQISHPLPAVEHLARMSLLVHEARHSDCTHGIRRSDLKKMIMGIEASDKTCGQVHVVCPEGHDYAGVHACDASPWGAYAVDSVFVTRLAQCEDCPEEYLQAAMIMGIDRRSRVLVRDDMFRGVLGKPDMTHNPKLIEDTP